MAPDAPDVRSAPADPLAMALGNAILGALRAAVRDGSFAASLGRTADGRGTSGPATPAASEPAAEALAPLPLPQVDLPTGGARPTPAQGVPAAELRLVSEPEPETSELVERFTLGRLAGADPGGETHLAHDRSGNEVVVRLLPIALAADATFMTRLRDKGRRLSRIDHPHVARTIASGTHYRRPFVVGDPVRGRSLVELMAAGAPMAEADVLRLAEQACMGLQEVHLKAGICHPDLGLEAIQVEFAAIAGAAGGESENIRVAGFLAPGRDWHRRGPDDAGDPEGVALPCYVAPECFAARIEDPAKDIYALGAIMYHLLTGVPPFPGDAQQMREGHVQGAIPDPGTLRPALSEATRAIVRTAMGKRPDDRFLSHQGFIVACHKAARSVDSGRVRSMRFLRKALAKRARGERSRQEAADAGGSSSQIWVGEGSGLAHDDASGRPGGGRLIEGSLRLGGSPDRPDGAVPGSRRIVAWDRVKTPLPDDLPRDLSTRIVRKHRMMLEAMASGEVSEPRPVPLSARLPGAGSSSIRRRPARATGSFSPPSTALERRKRPSDPALKRPSDPALRMQDLVQEEREDAALADSLIPVLLALSLLVNLVLGAVWLLR